MPVTARTSGARAVVRGGRRLERFISRLTDPRVTGPAFARALATVLRQFVIPRVKQDAPMRTGALRRSFQVRQRGENVVILVAFYGRFVSTFGASRNQTLVENVMRHIADHRDEFVRQADLELRRALGI